MRLVVTYRERTDSNLTVGGRDFRRERAFFDAQIRRIGRSAAARGDVCHLVGYLQAQHHLLLAEAIGRQPAQMLGVARRRVLRCPAPPYDRTLLDDRAVGNGPERRASVDGVEQIPVRRAGQRGVVHVSVSPNDAENQVRSGDALRRERDVEIFAFVLVEIPPLAREHDAAIRHQSLLFGSSAAVARADDIVEVR